MPRANVEEMWPERDVIFHANQDQRSMLSPSSKFTTGLYERPYMHGGISPYTYNASLDRSTYNDVWQAEGGEISSDAIVQALDRLTPSLRSKDAAAVERVVGLLRQGASPY